MNTPWEQGRGHKILLFRLELGDSNGNLRIKLLLRVWRFYNLPWATFTSQNKWCTRRHFLKTSIKVENKLQPFCPPPYNQSADDYRVCFNDSYKEHCKIRPVPWVTHFMTRMGRLHCAHKLKTSMLSLNFKKQISKCTVQRIHLFSPSAL